MVGECCDVEEAQHCLAGGLFARHQHGGTAAAGKFCTLLAHFQKDQNLVMIYVLLVVFTSCPTSPDRVSKVETYLFIHLLLIANLVIAAFLD